MGRPAVFLDRDGTLIAEKGYLCRPEEVNLLPGAARAVRLLREAGFFLVLVTNQAAIAKGLLTEAQLAQIHERLQKLLECEGTNINAFYYCPHHPAGRLAVYRKRCPCRKPAPGMLLRAAREHCLCLPNSFLVGDKLTDVAAGRRAGCRTILVTTGHGEDERAKMRRTGVVPDFIRDNLAEAARLICTYSRYPRARRCSVSCGSTCGGLTFSR